VADILEKKSLVILLREDMLCDVVCTETNFLLPVSNISSTSYMTQLSPLPMDMIVFAFSLKYLK